MRILVSFLIPFSPLTWQSTTISNILFEILFLLIYFQFSHEYLITKCASYCILVQYVFYELDHFNSYFLHSDIYTFALKHFGVSLLDSLVRYYNFTAISYNIIILHWPCLTLSTYLPFLLLFIISPCNYILSLQSFPSPWIASSLVGT